MSSHIPVMCADVMGVLAPRDGARYVDGTFGAGGYTQALLDAAKCTVYAIDCDPSAIRDGAALAETYGTRLVLIEGKFGDMQTLLARHGVDQVDGVALDLGVSSMQLDDAARGFSFRFDAPLDMRMGQSGQTAADVVNHATEHELADLIHELGEERRARAIARAIVAARAKFTVASTHQLANIVRSVVRKARDGIDPATRTFQALRIFVNQELAELDQVLSAIERLLTPGGHLAVVSFHSLEDRRVKSFLRERCGEAPRPSRHLPTATEAATNLPKPSFSLLFRGVRKPAAAEISHNPRARSARLRAATRTDAPVWSERHAA